MYELGGIVAFCFWVVWVGMIIVNAHSQLAKNLAKVDLRLSWLSQQPVPKGDRSGAGWVIAKCIFLLVSLIVSLILSWASVILSLAIFAYNKSKSYGMPTALKEMRWKMRNIDLSRDQVLVLFDQAASLVAPAGQPGVHHDPRF